MSKYSSQKNIQILIALLKKHGIKRVIASPGTRNIPIVGGIQSDPYFEIYSSVDEREAAYMACGLAAETGEPVVLTCTGATASRNYLSGLTEAYYRKLPILVITPSDPDLVGHLVPQIIDQDSLLTDVVKYSTHVPAVEDEDDFWECEIKVNMAILELTRNSGGPVHIALEIQRDFSFNNGKLPEVRLIRHVKKFSEFPKLPDGKIAILIGSHKKMTSDQIDSLEHFCEVNNAVVLGDHTSGYKGKYFVLHSISSSQMYANYDHLRPDLVIHLGEVSGDYSIGKVIGKEVWRVSEDGEIRDPFKRLSYVFEIDEQAFFNYYAENHHKINEHDTYLKVWKEHLKNLYEKIPELPFSNFWIAWKIHNLIPENSAVHFGILNSLRAWNFFELPNSVDSYSNIGGFGIDGCLPTLVGSSLSNEKKLYFGIIGDLSFFYGMNALGNRHIKSNLRILLVNNGKGAEFKLFTHPGFQQFGEQADKFIAAAGHFSGKNPDLVKNYCESLGFEYLRASNKEEFRKTYERFLDKHITERPMLLEVFTNDKDESEAYKVLKSLDKASKQMLKTSVKKAIKKTLGENNARKIKKFFRNI